VRKDETPSRAGPHGTCRRRRNYIDTSSSEDLITLRFTQVNRSSWLLLLRIVTVEIISTVREAFEFKKESVLDHCVINVKT
jgi:hypothetical protein